MCENVLQRPDINTFSCAAQRACFQCHHILRWWHWRAQILDDDLPPGFFPIHHEVATAGPLPTISHPTPRDMRSTCAMHYHTNWPSNCSVFRAILPNHSDWPEVLEQMGGWLSLVWNHFSERCLCQLLVLCVWGCTFSLKGNLSRWKLMKNDFHSKMFYFGRSSAT